MRKKIGIMGGTFNPVHYGHLLLAESAREVFELDKVLFMPSGNPYMKNFSAVLAGEKRMQMLRLAIEGNPCFEVSEIELDREGPTYTCDTLAELKKQNSQNQYYFIMGADSLLMLESWKDPAFILQNCIVLAALRGTGTKEETKQAAEYFVHEYQADIRMLPSRYIDISSSDIRSHIRTGASVRYMLPDKVIEYIRENKLYLE